MSAYVERRLFALSMCDIFLERLIELSTDWFNVTSCVRQGDTLSPILFSLFINELAVGFKNLNLGIYIGGKLSILLYADDIVLMSESEENLQKILDYCHK